MAKMWDGIFGFLDGLGGVAERVNNFSDDAAGVAENLARGRAALANQRADKRGRDLDLAEQRQDIQLEAVKVERGDNRELYWAGAFVAGLVILLVVR
ncbi:hypothetical protein [Neotabrizicola shimadae]|uniref:Uncharacterized protein n=1 Tax=Neotabrizicola shimadae TaxID=2807096 RepID=A0A8G0ZXG1_9RHOB|nr:hypothetical protein [Neotabrizicola shimadae]QYZ71225.1 hypothetical protein JO391_06890 [Neotabrizicola shimadae]